MQIPNHTQIPNIFIDQMHKFTSEEVKIFLAICRKTIGWHKISDRISYSQLNKMTGIKHHQTFKNGIDKLVKSKLIVRKKTKAGYFYDIGFTMSRDDICHSMAQSPNDIAMSQDDTGVSPNDIKPRHGVTPQKIKDTKLKDTLLKDNKKTYSEFVKLTLQQYEKLINDYEEPIIKDYIVRLNNYIGSKGKRYKSHYHTILNWMRRDNVKSKNGKGIIEDLKYKKVKQEVVE